MEVMQMGTLRHRKPIVSKPADRKITIKKPKTPGKFGKFARRLGLVAGITTGIIAPSLSNAQGSIKTQVNKPTDKQTEIMMAAAGERSLPRNTYIVPARDGKDSLRGYAPDRNEKRIEPGSDPKKKYTSSADIEHLDYYIPSDIEIDATRSCIMIKARSVKNFDGTILKASEKSCYFYYPSEE